MPDWTVLVLGLHVLGASVWLGGSIALGVVASTLRTTPDGGARTAEIARRIGWVLWPALALTILTGAANTRLFLPSSGSWTSAASAPWLAAKLGTVAAMTSFAGIHSFVVGPAVRRERSQGASEARLGRLSRLNAALGAATAVSGAIAVMLGVVLANL